MPSTRICFKCIRFCKIRVYITVFLKYHASTLKASKACRRNVTLSRNIRMFGLCFRVQASFCHWKMSEINAATSA